MSRKELDLRKEKDQEELIILIYKIIYKIIYKKTRNGIELEINLYKSNIDIKDLYEIEIIRKEYINDRYNIKLNKYYENILVLDNKILNKRINTKEIEKDLEELILIN
ncbi:hypothetical protein V6O07_23260 [Arthrospira platensis SPKY2]